MPDMKALYKFGRYCPRGKDNLFTFEHYYREDLFLSSLDKQIHELNNRFNDQAMDLLTLGSSLLPKKDAKVLSYDEICVLVKKYYPNDFTGQETNQKKYQLELFKNIMPKNSKLSGVSSIVELCERLVQTKKNETFFLLNRLIRLILTLPVSTCTTERGFSTENMKESTSQQFLASNLVVYTEKEIAENFDSVSVIDEFKRLKDRRADF